MTTAVPADVRVLGACPHDCPDTCSLITTVRDGVAIRVQGNPQHPETDGVLCTKVSRYTERTYHPQRLLQPLRRVGPKGPQATFVPVSWDEALDDIAHRLGEIAATDPEAILPYSYAGTMGQVQGESMAARFFHRLGAARLDRTICASAGAEALIHTLGAKLGMKVAFFSEAKLILIWGSNSIGSNLHFWRLAQQAKRQGARLVCIDPRRSETADKCDEHLALRPGTDAALALSLMHELIVHDWIDHDYVARYTLGWEQLKARALQWPPQRAAQVCGLDVEAIVRLARDYGTTQPAAIRLNYGVQRARGGGNTVRAIACLPALTGAWRHRAGGMLLSNGGHQRFNTTALQRPDLLGPRRPRVLNMSTIGQHLAPDAPGRPVRALVVYNSNPVAVAPDSPSVVAGFAREDLFTVVLEHFRTDTADYADYLLPATTQLEHWDVHATYGHTDVLLNRPAIAPLGQARSNTEIFRQLAKRMGFDDPCFEEDDAHLCRQAITQADGRELVPWSELLTHGFATIPSPQALFAHGQFPTPSGRCEFFSERLAAQGLDGLPDYLPNHELPAPNQAYPLAMISPPARHFLNSTFVNVTSLRAIEAEQILEIHPLDAQARGIEDGQTVTVFNDRGRHVCKARVSERPRPGLVVGLGIWWRKDGMRGTNVNELTSQALTDLGRAPTFYDCAVEVSAAPQH